MEEAQSTQLLLRFFDCSAASAKALAENMLHREYAPRTVLSHQGDLPEYMWLILEGTVQLQAISSEGQSTVISAFGPGELIGVHEDAQTSAFDTIALTKTRALRVRALSLRTVLEDCPDLAVGLSSIYSGQLMAVLDRLAARVTLSATGRFYRELLRSAGKSDCLSPPPVVAALALSAQTTRETGSRAMTRLERRGIIERDSEKLTITSRRMLEELIV